MNTESEFSISSGPSNVSLSRGGPFYRFQLAVKLIHPDRWNLARRITVAVAISWLPLILITALSNFGALSSLMSDYRVHSRLLIAVPVLLFGELLLESRFRTVWFHLRRAELLKPQDLKYMDEVIVTLHRLRDSLAPECLIVILLMIHTLAGYHGLIDASPWLAKRVGADLHLTGAGWYAVLVSTSIFQFLLGLSIWRWGLWTLFAFRLSTRDLKLVPTHPDEHGGLGFLGLTAGGVCSNHVCS